MTLNTPGPTAFATSMAKSRPGKAWNTSTPREMAMSIAPP